MKRIECSDHCSLWEKADRHPCIQGDGSDHPTWLFVGEAPGFNEDRTGRNFCGKTGTMV
ncbi:MAG: uracil-DNA glycosylase, partial [Deltaproteobacteria bacterium]